MRYEEVRLDFLPGGQEGYRVRATFEGRAPIEENFSIPPGCTAEDLYGEWYAAFSDRTGEALRRAEVRREEVGKALFDEIFRRTAVPLRERLIALSQRAADDELCGLRLRFALGDAIGEGTLAAAALLPVAGQAWEAMYDRDYGRILARSPLVSIVRTLGAADPPRPVRVRVEDKLRVLVVDAQPEGASPIGWKAEKARIKRGLSKWDSSEVRFLPRATFEQTCSVLAEGFHVVHFIGHGGFDARRGQWFLLFEKNRQKDWVHAKDVAGRFAEIPTLRVAVLNACETGAIDGIAGRDPLSGVAAALSVHGVPIVVGMQVPVTDGMAVEFADAFYGSLRSGLPVEMAVSAGRQAVLLSSPEWATPVVYMRGASSDLFEFVVRSPSSEEPAALRSAVVGDAPRELHVGIRSFLTSKDLRLADWAAELDETTERFLPLHHYFEGRFIRRPEDWKERLLPQLEIFLLDAVHQKRPLVLHLAAHLTVAFAAGWFFHTKEDAALSLIQWTGGKPGRWTEREGTVPKVLWKEPVEIEKRTGKPDVAIVIEATAQKIQAEVDRYLDRAGLPVHRLIHVSVAGEGKEMTIESGAHAYALAWSLYQKLKQNPAVLDARRLHLFLAAPVGFAFLFGKLARSLGSVRLYEYDMEKSKHKSYEPSLDLGPEVEDDEAGGAA